MQPCGARAARQTTRGAQFPACVLRRAVKGRVPLSAFERSARCRYSLNGNKMRSRRGQRGILSPIIPSLGASTLNGLGGGLWVEVGWSVRHPTHYPKGIIRPPIGTPPLKGAKAQCYLFGVDNIRRGGVYLHDGKIGEAYKPLVIPPHSHDFFLDSSPRNPPTNPHVSV